MLNEVCLVEGVLAAGQKLNWEPSFHPVNYSAAASLDSVDRGRLPLSWYPDFPQEFLESVLECSNKSLKHHSSLCDLGQAVLLLRALVSQRQLVPLFCN